MSVSGGDSPEAALSPDSQYILKSIFLKLPVKGPQSFQTLERLSRPSIPGSGETVRLVYSHMKTPQRSEKFREQDGGDATMTILLRALKPLAKTLSNLGSHFLTLGYYLSILGPSFLIRNENHTRLMSLWQVVHEYQMS